MTFAIIATSTVMYTAVLFAMDVAMHKFGADETNRRLRKIYRR
jgi:hypothetical protein